MSEFWYIASTGRCGTQFLARCLHDAGTGAFVIHERLGDQHCPRRVLRDPEARYAQLGRNVGLQRLYLQAENQLQRGHRFVTCDWHAFSWLDYYAERFGEAFRFLHLVRNPYDVAASHATHTPMDPGRLTPSDAACRVFATDPGVRNGQFAEAAPGFSIFERHLFHWLEVAGFIAEQRSLPGFRGVLRFEDVMTPDRQPLAGALTRILGQKVDPSEAAPFDRVHRGSPWPLDFAVTPALADTVDALAERLGYSAAELEAARDPDRLAARYSAPRHDALPCDPSIPVIAR